MHDAMCDAEDEDGELTCVLPEDHIGGHYDPEQGEWANDDRYCPIYQERHGRKHFCIKPRNHWGGHVHPVTGGWPQDEKEPLGTCPGIEPPSQEDYERDLVAFAKKGLRDVIAWPLNREALKRERMARRPVTKP